MLVDFFLLESFLKVFQKCYSPCVESGNNVASFACLINQLASLVWVSIILGSSSGFVLVPFSVDGLITLNG